MFLKAQALTAIEHVDYKTYQDGDLVVIWTG